ncbi:MAG: SIS domain-containing protein [Chlorobi bacterium]|nr:SIS domain-containing protein [Chlorobiota bacterium]
MNKFLDEIFEQSSSLENTFGFYENDTGKSLLKRTLTLYNEKKFTEIIFTGMGSSYFTSYLTSCLLNEYGIRSYAINASELLHYHFSLITADTLLVCVSQSGESYEVIKILQKLKPDITCLAITNEALSPLAQNSSVALLSKAGHEEMTSSKTYTSIALVMLISGWVLAGKWTKEMKMKVRQMIDNFNKLLNGYNNWMPEITDFLGDYNFIEIIGRGPSYASVLQGALMFKEAVRSPSEGILGGDFRHGPMEMVKEGFRAIIFAPKGKTFDQSVKMAVDIAGFNGKVVLITNADLRFSEPNIHVLQIPVEDEYLFAVSGVIPLQFIVISRALDLGLKPGYFTRGAKVTKEE